MQRHWCRTVSSRAARPNDGIVGGNTARLVERGGVANRCFGVGAHRRLQDDFDASDDPPFLLPATLAAWQLPIYRAAQRVRVHSALRLRSQALEVYQGRN